MLVFTIAQILDDLHHPENRPHPLYFAGTITCYKKEEE